MSTCVLGRYVAATVLLELYTQILRYVAATVLLVLYTQILRRTLTASVWTYRYAEIKSECLFSGVTSSGRVCRKVPKKRC